MATGPVIFDLLPVVCLIAKVKRSGGGYIDVPFLPDVVLVNLGILMQMWTGDTYLATVS